MFKEEEMRRAKGEGSLSQRKNGTWAAQIAMLDSYRNMYYSKTKNTRCTAIYAAGILYAGPVSDAGN
jgi:flagellar biosynthesis chaperone FliJ